MNGRRRWLEHAELPKARTPRFSPESPLKITFRMNRSAATVAVFSKERASGISPDARIRSNRRETAACHGRLQVTDSTRRCSVPALSMVSPFAVIRPIAIFDADSQRVCGCRSRAEGHESERALDPHRQVGRPAREVPEELASRPWSCGFALTLEVVRRSGGSALTLSDASGDLRCWREGSVATWVG